MSVKPEKTKYAGVTFIEVTRPTGGTERSYYVTYRDPITKKLKNIAVGRSIRDDMTPARAASIRGALIEGKRKTRKDQQAADAARPTIEALWVKYKGVNSHKPGLRTDLYIIKHLARFFGQVPSEITTQDVERLKQDLFKSSFSAQTVKHSLALLKRLIRFGVRNNLCDAPTRLHFEMPSVDNQVTECLTAEQISTLLSVLDEEDNQNLASLMRLALFTGMRRGALLGLRWNDIDFEKGFITLRGEIAKSGKTERIPLSTAAKQVLQNIAPVGDSEFVFPGRDGKQRVELRRFTNKIREKAGLPKDFRPLHGLRHTYASLLASSGEVDLYTLQKLLTHNSPQMTQRYAHLADEALQRAAKVADGLFSVFQP